jgi:UDP-2-acetamido-3-amino-2,3-dideoxy-glucuronate N-acetyltransferase
MNDERFFVHPSAVVDAGAEIGSGTRIWHFCHIFAGARIGKNCVVGQGCSVAATVRIGDGVKLQNGISVYDGVVIEDEVFCGPHMVFTNVINPRAFIERKSEFQATRVCRGATIGAGAVVLCGTTIGRCAFVGAGAVVTKDVLPFALVYGNPARQHGWVGKCGTPLHFDETSRAVGEDGTCYVLRNGVLLAEDEI